VTGRAWTRPADVRVRLRRRWDSGELPRQWVSGAAWAPYAVPLRGPTAAELADRFDEVAAWARDWRSHGGPGRVELRPVGARSIGSNQLPDRLWLESYDDVWRLLGVQAEVRRLGELRDATQREDPRLVGWLDAHPLAVLGMADRWLRLVRTLGWLERTRGSGLHLRQVPVPGVDTKLIQHHAALLAELLDLVLPPGEADPAQPRSQLARRYGFATRPSYVRFRLLDGALARLPGVSEVTVRAEEMAAAAPDVATAYVVENETTYLAFPAVPDAVVLFGSGYAKAGIVSQPWLDGRRVVYWGDIDTHGFAILDQVRAAVPHVESLLMDRATLLAHEGQWVREESPRVAALPHLSEPEADLYRDLVEGVLGPRVRLEQERVGFAWLTAALGRVPEEQARVEARRRRAWALTPEMVEDLNSPDVMRGAWR